MTNSSRSGQFPIVAVRAEPSPPPAPAPLAFREVFVLHAGYVWNSMRRLGVPPSDLEDLTHDVFVEVHRHFADYDPARPIKPWLFGFAFRVASQHRRRLRRRSETSAEPAEVVDPGALPDARVAADQDRRLVLAALQHVEPGRRAVFVLYEIDGVPMHDIATALGIPVNTAYSRLRLARAEFADAVKKLRRGER